MNNNNAPQAGELPSMDWEIYNTNLHLSRKIRENILSRRWPAETSTERQMLQAFKVSGLTIEQFLNGNKK
jgi:hypothetical protein|tara:strand:+ start:314 stop:523 length:210 start_codon:yes stop_codon:yes gene_type:complete